MILLQKVDCIMEANWMHRNLGKTYSILETQPVGIFCKRADKTMLVKLKHIIQPLTLFDTHTHL